MQAPLDSSQGSHAGKRRHQPIVIKKEADQASPWLLAASWRDETFDKIELEVVEIGPQGPKRVVNTVTLTKATIRSIWDDYSIPRRHLHRIELDFEDVSMFWPCRRWPELSS